MTKYVRSSEGRLTFCVGLLVALLLVAIPAYATTTGLPPIPPSDRVGNSGQEASTSANAPGAQAILAPDPVATNGLYYVNVAQITINDVVYTDIAYDVRLSNPATNVASAPDAPACHANVTLTFCCDIVKVTVPGGVTEDVVYHTITLGNVPIGSSRIIVRVKGAVSIYSDALPYTMSTDDGRTWNKTADGVKCGPNAVTLVSFTAAPGASSVNAAPQAGKWVRVPGCYLIGRVPASWTYDIAACRRWQRPIIYVWRWIP